MLIYQTKNVVANKLLDQLREENEFLREQLALKEQNNSHIQKTTRPATTTHPASQPTNRKNFRSNCSWLIRKSLQRIVQRLFLKQQKQWTNKQRIGKKWWQLWKWRRKYLWQKKHLLFGSILLGILSFSPMLLSVANKGNKKRGTKTQS